MALNFKKNRADLARANEIATQLEQLLQRENTLVQSVKKSATQVRDSQVLQELAKLPVDRLRDATTETVRVETLRKFGYDHVAAVYNTTVPQLERIPGITLEAAQHLKELASQMYEAVSESIYYGIDLEDITKDERNLIESIQSLDVLKKETKNNLNKIQPLSQKLKESLDLAHPTKSRFRWFLTSSEKKSNALEAIETITYMLGDPVTMSIVEMAVLGLRALEREPADAINDFRKRSGDYFAILEEVTDYRARTDADRHFNQELLDKIEAQDLDVSNISATLRRYQTFGGKFAIAQNRVIIGDEMGLGKTLQAISALSHRQSQGAHRFLVVAPASVMTNWIREIESRSELKVTKIHGEDHPISLQTWKSVSGIGLTTFDTLKSFEITDQEISDLKVDTIVVDEAHYVKNAQTGRAKTITRWLERTPNAIFLTGTPMENRVDEFVALANLLDKEISLTLNRAFLSAGPEPFRRAVAPIYLRRNANEVLKELPELIEISDFCDWDGIDEDNYRLAVEKGNFMAMRRAAFVAQPGKVTSKLERLTEIVEESIANNKKVLIFSYFKTVIEEIMNALGDKAIGPITGATSASQRQLLVDAFQDDPNPRALVGQIQAAGTGLNIQQAQVVIICEPQVKPSLEVQAIARAYRMGQVNKVQVHRLILPSSVDEQMLAMLAQKQQDFDAFARHSELANSSENAKDISEESLARAVISEERKRLGINDDASKIEIGDEE